MPANQSLDSKRGIHHPDRHPSEISQKIIQNLWKSDLQLN